MGWESTGKFGRVQRERFWESRGRMRVSEIGRKDERVRESTKGEYWESRGKNRSE